MKYVCLVLLVAVCCSMIKCNFTVDDDLPLRETRAIPILSYEAQRIVGKTFRFASLTNVSDGVTLTLNRKPLNFANLHINRATALSLDKYLKDEPLYDRLYVFSKLAAIEGLLSARTGKRLTNIGIEDLSSDDLEDDIVLDKEDVDEMWEDIHMEPELLDLSPVHKGPTDQIDPIFSTFAIHTPGPLYPMRPDRLPYPPRPPGAVSNGLRRVKRKVTAKKSRKWNSNFIPWKFATSFPSSFKTVIESAIHYWEAETCLDFRKNACNIFRCIRFKKKTGCYSKVGRRLFGQTISIGNGCDKKGIVAHEIGHALGFWHEQSRPDRDRYVKIHSENIKAGKKHNFVRKSWKHSLARGVPYDYSSAMHYGIKYFSKNGEQTISTKETDMDKTTGSRYELSFFDIKLMNLHYCNGKCSGGLKTFKCRNDGYKNPKNCGVCKCPDGWSGKYCTDVKPGVNANCGTKTLSATSSWKYMTSPKYTSGGYPGHSECTWLIKAPYGKRVLMMFVNTFSIRCHSTNCKDYVEVRYGNLARTGRRYCCSSRPPIYYRSHGTKMLILLRVRGSSSYKGFKLKYKYEPCGGYSFNAADKEPVCYVTLKYSCPGKYKIHCGFLWLFKCTRYRANSCYRTIKTCSSSYIKIGNYCYRKLSKWSRWSSCSATCGACGIKRRTRTCLRPPCSESLVQTVRCNRKLCPGFVGTMTKKCSYKGTCGWFFWKHSCIKYKTCTVKIRCCTGFVPKGNYCYRK